MVLGSTGCSFPLGTVAANKCSCSDQQQQQMGTCYYAKANSFPLDCTVRYHEPERNVNCLDVGSQEDLGR